MSGWPLEDLATKSAGHTDPGDTQEHMGAGRLYLVLRGNLKGHRSEERVSDDWVADEWVAVFLAIVMDYHSHDRFYGYGYGGAMRWP